LTSLYAIRITDKDCETAGIFIEPSTGDTGVEFVDDRHVDLKGTPSAFTKLASVIVQRIWEGQQRTAIFAQFAVLGELAVFSKSEKVDEGAKQRCKEVLFRYSGACSFLDAENVLQISGQLSRNPEPIPVIARRALHRCTNPSNYPYRSWLQAARQH
jgi:hypothetical protein